MTAYRRHDPHPARKALLGAGIGLLLLLVSAGMFVQVSARIGDIREYERAPACPAGKPSDDCTTMVPGVVKGTEKKRVGKGHHYWLLLSTEGSDTVRRVRMEGAEPVYDAVRTGDKVTLTYWHGKLSAVRFGADTQETWASPAYNWRTPLGVALGTLPLGLMLMAMGWWYYYRRPHQTTAIPLAFTTGWAGLLLVAGAGCMAGLAGPSVPVALLLTAVSVPPSLVMGLLFAWGAREHLAKAADTSDVVPALPKGKQSVRATVSGAVPYRGDDGADTHCLVVGDGPLTITPYPQGYAPRVPLPGLTVRRVRAFQLGDPETWYWVYKLNGVVLECQDGARPVLIATRRRDAPLILGALTLPWGPTNPWPQRYI